MKRMEIGSGKLRKTGFKLIGGVIESCLFVNRKKCVVFWNVEMEREKKNSFSGTWFHLIYDAQENCDVKRTIEWVCDCVQNLHLFDTLKATQSPFGNI